MCRGLHTSHIGPVTELGQREAACGGARKGDTHERQCDHPSWHRTAHIPEMSMLRMGSKNVLWWYSVPRFSMEPPAQHTVDADAAG